MTTAETIHAALQEVATLRQQRVDNPPLNRACAEVRAFQARRFQATYLDLITSPRYKAAASFFLEELYSEKDYTDRDTQFARIVNTMTKIFPHGAVQTAAALVQVHALSERLDTQMAHEWLQDEQQRKPTDVCERYVRCWRQLGNAAARQEQLDRVIRLGRELERLTSTRGLRTLLKMMRNPARMAGLSALQHFLETGFDAFAHMHGAETFLQTVKARETDWSHALFHQEFALCTNHLRHLLNTGQP